MVCFDESPTQLIGEVRQPIPAEPGQLERYDCEYRRNGTVNLFVFLDAHRPWRKVKVTERRAAADFAALHARARRCPLSQGRADPRRARQPVDPLARRALPDLPGARSATACCAAWSSTTPPSTPAGSTWSRSRSASCASQCLDRRIESDTRLVAEIAAWEHQRNAARARINWMFTTEKARAKMGRAYPKPAATSDRRQRVKTSVTRY